MKVFFGSSQRGKKFYDSFYKEIYQELNDLGLTHLDNDLVKISTQDFYRHLEAKGRNAYFDLYRRKIDYLIKADVCVFECSLPSLSIGFLIERSLELHKPTIILYYKDNLPFFLMGNQNYKLIASSYNDRNIKTVVKRTIAAAKKQQDKRFNFFINPRLLSYLETESKKLNVSKSSLIRELIEERMKKTAV